MREELVAAQIERPNDHRVWLKRRRHLLVSLVLLLLLWKHFTVDEQIFRPEQTDSLRSAGNDRLRIGGLFDVGRKRDAKSVQRHGRLVLHFAQLFFQRDLLANE